MLNAAWDACIPLASENALPCYDREGYNKILENAKPLHNPDGRHLSVFTYLRLSPVLMERHNFQEFERFVKRMHGMVVLHFSPSESITFSFGSNSFWFLFFFFLDFQLSWISSIMMIRTVC